MRRLILTLTFCLVAGVISAAPPTLKVPEEVPVPLYSFGQIKAVGEFEFIKWKLPKALKFTSSEGPELIFTGPPGEYQAMVWASNKEGLTDLAVIKITIGDGKVLPGPPGPPTPPPGPPAELPIPGDGLRVLIVAESGDLTKMPGPQQAILYSKTVRDYLNQKCPIGPDGVTHEWRIYDPDTDVKAESKTWQQAMSRPRKSVPWIVISNGKIGFEGVLPSSIDETMTLLKKYGD